MGKNKSNPPPPYDRGYEVELPGEKGHSTNANVRDSDTYRESFVMKHWGVIMFILIITSVSLKIYTIYRYSK